MPYATIATGRTASAKSYLNRLRFPPQLHDLQSESYGAAVFFEFLPGAFQNIERLERPPQPLRARHPEALELLGPIAKPDPQPQPSA